MMKANKNYGWPPHYSALLDNAVERLLLGEFFAFPPRDWRRWREPSQWLPIDNEITALAMRAPAPRLKDKSKMGVQCPYWHARFMVVAAVDMASREAAQPDKVRHAMAKRWESRAKVAGRLANQLAQSFGSSPPLGKVGFIEERWPGEAPASITDAYIDISKAVLALSHIAQYSRSRRELLINRQGDLWRLTFAATLGLAWRTLTGRDPANSKTFISFVRAAWESLSDEAEEFAWEWYVRRAVKDYAGWDRYDPDSIEQLPFTQSKVLTALSR